MSEKSDKLRAMLAKEKERRIKLNNRIEILERRIYLLNKKHLLSHLEGCTDIESNLQHWCNDIKNSCLM